MTERFYATAGLVAMLLSVALGIFAFIKGQQTPLMAMTCSFAYLATIFIILDKKKALGKR